MLAIGFPVCREDDNFQVRMSVGVFFSHIIIIFVISSGSRIALTGMHKGTANHQIFRGFSNEVVASKLRNGSPVGRMHFACNNFCENDTMS